MKRIDDYDGAVSGALIMVYSLDELQHRLHEIGIEVALFIIVFHVKR